MNLDTHPTDDELNDFLLGKLPDPAEGEVESHLAGCSACQARAATAQPGDTFVHLLTAANTRVTVVRAAATPQPSLSSASAATQVYSGPPIAHTTRDVPDGSAVPGAPAGLATHPRYRLVRQLGKGGMGDVWLAEHAVMGRPVALKVIRPEFLARPGAVERFHREVRAVAALHHPNIVTAYDADEADGTHFLVMEYVPGEALSDVVQRGRLPVADACRAVRDAARGLAHAHAAGLVHRDVKPANMIRATDGTVKVFDFGLVGSGAETAGLTGANMVMGTPDYIAPEQATDAHTADARSDVYSLGCTLYHLLAGRVPFPGTTLQKLDAHRDPTRTPDPIEGVPAKIARVLARMTAKDPAARYQTAEAVADSLDRFCVMLDDEAPPVATPLRSRRRLAIAAALVFALVAVAAGVVQHRIKTDKGELIIETTDDDVEVVVKQGGKVVTIYDPKSKQKLVLQSGTYEFELNGQPTGLKLDIDKATLKRGDTVIARIERATNPELTTKPPATTTPTEGKLPLKPGEVFVFRGHTDGLLALAVSPDGMSAVTGGSWPNDKDSTLRLWDLGTGKEVKQFRGHTNHIYSAAFSRDGERLISGSEDWTTRVWDVSSGKEVMAFDHPGIGFGVAFTRDGKQAVVATEKARLFDLSTKKDLLRFGEYRCHKMRSLALSPDESTLATGDSFGDIAEQYVSLWDMKTGKRPNLLGGHKGMIYALAWSPDGTRLASASGDGTVGVFDPKRVRGVQRLEHSRPVYGVAYSPGGKFLLTGCQDHAVRVWDAASGELVHTLKGHDLEVWSVAFTPDGKHALSVSQDKTMRMWKLPAAVVDPPKKP